MLRCSEVKQDSVSWRQTSLCLVLVTNCARHNQPKPVQGLGLVGRVPFFAADSYIYFKSMPGLYLASNKLFCHCANSYGFRKVMIRSLFAGNFQLIIHCTTIPIHYMCIPTTSPSSRKRPAQNEAPKSSELSTK